MWRDEAHILDMLLAAQDAMDFCAALDHERFMRDRQARYATARAIEIIGEAASRVSQATRSAHPGIPWSKTIGTRHRIVHDYSHIDWDVVWTIVQHELPALVAALKRIVPPAEGPDA